VEKKCTGGDLVKDEKGPFVVNHEECARLLRKLKIDARPGFHVEEIQICPNGRGVIYITFKEFNLLL